jgi:hypothetical protein
MHNTCVKYTDDWKNNALLLITLYYPPVMIVSDGTVQLNSISNAD